MATENWLRVGQDRKKSDASRTNELSHPNPRETAHNFDPRDFDARVDTGGPAVEAEAVHISFTNEEKASMREHQFGVFRKTLFQAVIFIDLLQAVWIGGVVAVFLFIPEMRVFFVGSSQASSTNTTNTTVHSSPSISKSTLEDTANWSISNTTLEDASTWKGTAWLVAFCLLFTATFITTCDITFLAERREKSVASKLFLFLLVNTFALLMGDIACIYQTEVMLSAMCLVSFAFIQLLLYLICTKSSPLSSSPHCTLMALVFHICLMSGVAFSISDLIYNSPWYYGLSSFLIAIFLLVAALYHAWPSNEHDSLKDLLRSHAYSYMALKLWFDVPFVIVTFFFNKSCFPRSVENKSDIERTRR